VYPKRIPANQESVTHPSAFGLPRADASIAQCFALVAVTTEYGGE
jgi:hypothetical protein